LWPWAKTSGMGGDQAANVLAQVIIKKKKTIINEFFCGKTGEKRKHDEINYSNEL
jgi:acetyl-CoA carboxylase carboxyltransferase component